ncbi:MAG: exonuclease domain-containing protein [Ignavibacterium sp.]|nr:exonuclease domain-containing protein [Ignavibacterium sp.]MDW8375606.1 exonuclease domain-containing protein [Ignavibacteriales bacterium]
MIKQNAITNTSFTVVDVETTGLSAKSERIIEIALVKVENLKIVEKFSSLINPQKSIPFFITSLTGISDEDVEDAPVFYQVRDKIIEFLEDSIIVAHNLPFDLSFLKNEFRIIGEDFNPENSICTLKLSRRMFSSLRSKSLGSVADFLKIKNKNSHRALGDAETTAKILIKLIRRLRKEEGIETLEDLIEYQEGVVLTPNLEIKPELKDDFYNFPNAPGVYYFVNNKNQIIYIGKAKSLRDRIKSYFLKNADKKIKKIVSQANRLHHIITNSELTALLLEAESIKKQNPKHNKMLKNYGSKYFIRVNKSEGAPFVDITNNFDFDGNDYFGLYHSRRIAQSIVNFINKTFAIRECNLKEFLKSKPCFLYDIQRCTAPCIGLEFNIQKHNEELNEVYKFLFGENQSALNRLLNKMKYYASQQEYEKAAEIKQLVDFLLNEISKSSILAEPINSARVLIEIDSAFENDYILLIDGKVYIKGYIYDNKNLFEQALDDYFNNTIQTKKLPTNEDLEKLKVTLSWLVKHRNRVKVFYLKNYTNKEELYAQLSSYKSNTAEKAIQIEPEYDYNI